MDPNSKWWFRIFLGGAISGSLYDGSFSVGSILGAPDFWDLPNDIIVFCLFWEWLRLLFCAGRRAD